MDAITRHLAHASQALDAGRFDDALAIGRELVRKHPQSAKPLLFVGKVYCLAGKHALAIPFLRRAATGAPGDTPTALTLAHALGETGLIEEAIQVARDCETSGDSAERATFDGQMLLGNLHRRRGDLGDALACFVRARDLASEDDSEYPATRLAAACNNVANVLSEVARFDEAVGEYRRAIDAAPRFVDAWANLASALLALGQFEAAENAARRAVALEPKLAAAWLSLGSAQAEQGRWADACRAYDALLTLEPLSTAARYNRSLARLALGDWSAWEDYRLRHAVEPTIALASGLPRWRGESLDGKTVLVRREQGIGTQIMFSGYLPALANVTGKVVVECDARLRPLLARTWPGIEFAASAEIPTDGREGGAGKGCQTTRFRDAMPDVEVAIGDLPGALRRSSGHEAWDALVLPPRLRPDAELRAKWNDRLARLGAALRVGISWRGGGTPSARQKRSTTLDAWSPVFAAAGVEFVSLQYGDVECEISEFERRAGVRMHRWNDFDPRDDLDDLAALIQSLDLVISVDNSTVHLAGAIGTPVWVLLPRAADWRWLVERSDSPWYPAAELFRPAEERDGWPHVFSRAGERLQRLVRQRRRATSQAG